MTEKGKLLRFTKFEEKPIWVNVCHIVSIESRAPYHGTRLMVGLDTVINIMEETEDVKTMVRNALNA